MKSVFDPHNNFDEWFENDWESDEYMRIHEQEKNQPEGKHDWIWYLVIVAVGTILSFIISDWLKG